MVLSRMLKARHTHVELSGSNQWLTEVRVGPHAFKSDTMASSGGKDLAPDPEELLLASYGSCSAMTVQMYAQRKNWPLKNIIIDLELFPKSPGQPYRITRTIMLVGPLDDTQCARLLQIADKCPIHRILAGTTELITRAAEISHE